MQTLAIVAFVSLLAAVSAVPEPICKQITNNSLCVIMRYYTLCSACMHYVLVLSQFKWEA